ncbi:MAG: sugar ABC transporter permease [Spirochaetales bacterium]|nr:sugar ABC transporter permease [Spirochaetales bacterium]
MSRRALKTPSRFNMFLGLFPTLLIFSFVFVFPLFFSIRLSFFDWKGGSSLNFVGLKNFLTLFSDKNFWNSFKNTFSITVLVVIGQVGLGLIISVLLVTKYIRWRGVHRTLIFLPVVLSPVVVGLVWGIIYNKRNGLLDLFLSSLGMSNIPLWLDDPNLVLYTVSVPVIWQFIGLYMIMFLGALESIPKSILESAELDGTNGYQRTVKIMLPMIYPTFKAAMMICVSGTLKIFDQIYVLTEGGPGQRSMTMSLFNYRVSFNMMRFSYGASMSIIMIIITLAITGITIKMLGGRRYE